MKGGHSSDREDLDPVEVLIDTRDLQFKVLLGGKLSEYNRDMDETELR